MKRIITVITLCAALMGSEIAMASSEYSYKNRKYESPKIDITITGFEKGKDYEDSPTINVFFTLKNKTKKSIELEDTFTDYVEVWQNGSYLEPAVIDEGPHQKIRFT